MSPNAEHLFVNGIVAQRDMQPYIQLSNEHGLVAQMTMAQARNVAFDIVQMCARTEADAMVFKFFDKEDFPADAAKALMHGFRQFRMHLDAGNLETSYHDPDTGEKI